MTAFAVTSTDPRVNIFALAGVMETKGRCGHCPGGCGHYPGGVCPLLWLGVIISIVDGVGGGGVGAQSLRLIDQNQFWPPPPPPPFSGWHMERQTNSLHFSILPSHTVERAKEIVRDLRECVETVKVCIVLWGGLQIERCLNWD